MADAHFIHLEERPDLLTRISKAPLYEPEVAKFPEAFSPDALGETLALQLQRTRGGQDSDRWTIQDVVAVDCAPGRMLVNRANGSYVTLNSSSNQIWQGLEEGETFGQLLKRFLDSYEVEERVARRDIRRVLNQLCESGFLTSSEATVCLRGQISGLELEIQVPPGRLAEILTLLLQPSSGKHVDCCMVFRVVEEADEMDLPAPPESRPTGEVPVGYRGINDFFLACEDGSRFVIDYFKRNVVGSWLSPQQSSRLQIEANLQLLVDEFLKLEGIFPIHAAAVAKEGKSLLLIGASGSGKSSTALSFIQAGWSLVSDDHALLSEEGGRLKIEGNGTVLKADAAAWKRFPKLSRPLPASDLEPQHKLEGDFPAWEGATTPVVLIFPRVDRAAQSCLEVVDNSRALERLLPCALLALNPETTSRGLRLLARLVAELPCYRLHLGRDIETVPDLVLRELGLDSNP